MSTRYVALKLLGKRKKLEGKEGKDRRGVKAQQQLPRTIINHQERDNRIVQPTGEQLSLRWASNRTRYTLLLQFHKKKPKDIVENQSHK